MASTATLVMSVLNTRKHTQQPENAEYQSGDKAVNILEGWGGL